MARKSKSYNPFADYSDGVSAEEQAAFDALHPVIAEDTERHLAAQEEQSGELPPPSLRRAGVEHLSVRQIDDELPSLTEMDGNDEETPPPRRGTSRRASPHRRGRHLPTELPSEHQSDSLPPTEMVHPPGPSYAWLPSPVEEAESEDVDYQERLPAQSRSERQVIEVDETLAAHMDCLCQSYGMTFVEMIKTLAADRIRHDLKTGFILHARLSPIHRNHRSSED